MGPISLSEALIDQLARPLTPADRQRAALHLLDWLACALAARAEPARAPLLALYNRPADSGLALFDPACAPDIALLLDGALGSLLEMDDVHRAAVLHPGPVVIPAALAVARQGDHASATLLAAIVRGYELMIRIGRGMGQRHYAHWHPTSTLGGFGAAMAAADLLKLSREQRVWALGNAGTRTGGLWQLRHEPVPSKALHTAFATRDGWLAAQLAARGLAGPRQILDGPQGLLKATAADADAAVMIAPETDWLIHQVSFKPWPACRHAHPAIDALLALAPLPPAEAIDRIHVATYQAAIDFCDKPNPSTPAEARFSIQHALAAALVRGRPCLAQYHAECIADEQVSALRARISIGRCAALDQAFPDHYGAAVRLSGHDGWQREARIDDAWGDPENPLAAADLEAKARDLLAQGGLSERAAGELIEATLALADDAPLDAWLRRVAGWAA